jgi:hypothetical protein
MAARDEARKEATADALAAEMMGSVGNAKDFVLAQMIFEILKAQKTNDYSFFDGITNAATYKQFLRTKIKERLDQ